MGRTDEHGRNEAPRGRTRGAGAQASATRRTLATGPIGPPAPRLPSPHAAALHPRVPAGCQPCIGVEPPQSLPMGTGSCVGSADDRAGGGGVVLRNVGMLARRHVVMPSRCHPRRRLSPRGATSSRVGGLPAARSADRPRCARRWSHRCSWLRPAISTESSAHDCDQRALGTGSRSRTASHRTTRAALSSVSSAPLSPCRPAGAPESGALAYERCSRRPRAGVQSPWRAVLIVAVGALWTQSGLRERSSRCGDVLSGLGVTHAAAINGSVLRLGVIDALVGVRCSRFSGAPGAAHLAPHGARLGPRAAHPAVRISRGISRRASRTGGRRAGGAGGAKREGAEAGSPSSCAERCSWLRLVILMESGALGCDQGVRLWRLVL